MSKVTTTDQVSETVRRCISEALLVPIDRIVPSARLVSDLGAESIDVADIRFRIEEGLNIRIDQRQMTEALGSNLTVEEFDKCFTVQSVIDYALNQLAGVTQR